MVAPFGHLNVKIFHFNFSLAFDTLWYKTKVEFCPRSEEVGRAQFSLATATLGLHWMRAYLLTYHLQIKIHLKLLQEELKV